MNTTHPVPSFSIFPIPALSAAVIVVFSLMSALSARADSKVIADSARIEFAQSHSNLNLDLGSNRESLQRLSGRLSDMLKEGKLKKVVVAGAASPEGSVKINQRLSQARAESIFDYFFQSASLPHELTEFEYAGRDWPGLLKLVEADAGVPHKQEVIDMLEGEAMGEKLSSVRSDALLQRLKGLNGGRPYIYMYRHLFPRLRQSVIRIEVENENLPLQVCPEPVAPPSILEEVDVVVEEIDTVSGGAPDYVQSPKPFYMALKSNLLYDAAALPNVGVEFYLGKNWSVSADWTYGWWSRDSRHRYWRAYGGEVAVRKWFGSKAHEKPLTGHHVGVYAGAFTYDFEFGGRGLMGGLPGGTLWDRCMSTAGVEYGFSLPVARRLNIDFTIGIGYIGGKYIKYHPAEEGGYVWDSVHRLNWFGPTKLEITLVWLLGRGNVNSK